MSGPLVHNSTGFGVYHWGGARAEVEITEPDVRVILSNVLGVLIASLLDCEKGLQQMEDELEAKYPDGNVPMRTRTEYYNLVREHGIWKIDL